MKANVVFGQSLLKDATHRVTSIHVDNFEHSVMFGIEKGIKVDVVKLTIEHLEHIGFFNFSALNYLYENKLK